MRWTSRLWYTLAALLVLTGIAHAQTISPTTANNIISVQDSGTSCSVANTCVTFAVPSNTQSIAIGLTLTGSPTVTFQCTTNGSTWTSLLMSNMATGSQGSSATAAGNYAANTSGCLAVRVVGTTISSATATVTAAKGAGPGAGGASGGAAAAVTIVDGGDSAEGATTDAKITGDNAGTISAKLRGLNYLFTTAGGHVICDSGCSGGTTDADDGSIASGQTTGLSLGLSQVYDGSVWRRLTIGTAGTASAQVLTVQGIASMTPVQVSQATGTNLHIVCDSGCSSSTAPADEAAFTAGSTSQSPIGGFFQTTATNNALTNGQMGAWQFTAQRAGFVNLRTAAGVELTNTSNALDVNIKSGGSTTVTEAATITANQSNSALTAAVLFGYDGSTDSRLRSRAGLIGSTDVGLVTRPFVPSDGTNTMPTMDAAARPGFQKLTDGTNVYADPCAFLAPTTVAITQASATAQVYISAASSKKNYICALVLVAGAAEVINIIEGTGANCGSAQAAVIGSTTAANGMSFAANGGFVNPVKVPGIGTNTNTCVLTSGANRVAGYLTYVQQ